MQHANGATRRMSETAVFDVLRPIVRILKASGIEEPAVHAAVGSAYRRYRHSPIRGVWLDRSHFMELVNIVMTWARDPEFIDEAGSPMKLSVRSGPHSFASVVKKARASVNPSVALRHLQALRSVRLCNNSRDARLLSHVLLTVTGKRFLTVPMLNEIRRFAETIEYNSCETPGSVDGRMHRWAESASLAPSQFAEVQRFVRLSGQALLDSVDEKLLSSEDQSGKDGLGYGVGIYVFLDTKPRSRVRRKLQKKQRRSR